MIDSETDLRPVSYDTELLLDLLAQALMRQAAEGAPVEIQAEYDPNCRLSTLSNQVLLALRERLSGNQDYIIILSYGGIQLRHTPSE